MDSERLDVAGLFLDLLNFLNTYFKKRRRFGRSHPREHDTYINGQLSRACEIAEEVLYLAMILGLDAPEEDRGWNILWGTELQTDGFQEETSTQLDAPETDLVGLLQHWACKEPKIRT